MINLKVSTLLLASVTATLTYAQSLPRATPESQGVSSAGLLEYVTAADTQVDSMNSLMLLRHGKVIAEGWWGPYSPADRHMLYSLSKSFASTGVGIAIDEGKLDLLDPVSKFFPEDMPAEASANLKAMRVRDLLTMSTGQIDADVNKFSFASDEVLTKQFLHLPVAHKPGTYFFYNTPATYMCSAIVQKVTGQKLVDYLQPRLFGPLGIDRPLWSESKQGVSLGGYGLNVRTEDIAKFGQLYLQKGKWHDQQLISEDWIDLATSRQMSNGSSPNSDWEQGYGFQFWMCRHGLYRGDGAFGQFCIVMPQHDAVLAITSGTKDMGRVMELAWKHLLPAIKDEVLNEDSNGQSKLVAKLNDLKVALPSGASTSASAAKWTNRKFKYEGDVNRSLQFDFGNDQTSLMIEDEQGKHEVKISHGSWQRMSTKSLSAFDARQLPETSEHGYAASGAWSSDDTYEVKIVVYESPFYQTVKFKFEDAQVTIDAQYNVGWGESPKLSGKARIE
jgi:CubicO group peptidase (beta-lactamase class C family)